MEVVWPVVWMVVSLLSGAPVDRPVATPPLRVFEEISSEEPSLQREIERLTHQAIVCSQSV